MGGAKGNGCRVEVSCGLTGRGLTLVDALGPCRRGLTLVEALMTRDPDPVNRNTLSWYSAAVLVNKGAGIPIKPDFYSVFLDPPR